MDLFFRPQGVQGVGGTVQETGRDVHGLFEFTEPELEPCLRTRRGDIPEIEGFHGLRIKGELQSFDLVLEIVRPQKAPRSRHGYLVQPAGGGAPLRQFASSRHGEKVTPAASMTPPVPVGVAVWRGQLAGPHQLSGALTGESPGA